jgi:hypothetical protein
LAAISGTSQLSDTAEIGLALSPSIAQAKAGVDNMKAVKIPEDSPLRKPPETFSRPQVLILDGIRYAAEMADIAYVRLFNQLQAISSSTAEPSVRDIATAMLDAWSIIDSAHRFRDMVGQLPGLPNSLWKRLLRDRTEDAAELRDSVQHQLGEIDGLIANGQQLWGYLSWAEVRGKTYTGKWNMMAAGSVYVGNEYSFVWPPIAAPFGHVRLNAFGRRVYLGTTVRALFEAVTQLTNEIIDGDIRPIGQPANRRGADIVYEGVLEVLVSNAQPNPLAQKP